MLADHSLFIIFYDLFSCSGGMGLLSLNLDHLQDAHPPVTTTGQYEGAAGDH